MCSMFPSESFMHCKYSLKKDSGGSLSIIISPERLSDSCYSVSQHFICRLRFYCCIPVHYNPFPEEVSPPSDSWNLCTVEKYSYIGQELSA